MLLTYKTLLGNIGDVDQLVLGIPGYEMHILCCKNSPPKTIFLELLLERLKGNLREIPIHLTDSYC
ncbi:hypothetical protein GMMP15_640020 [Candidatus Magnetomoraceae bacterium gMMP-15]